MGINDRDHLRDESGSSGSGFNFIFRVCGVVAMLAIAFIFLRMPLPMFAKITLLGVAPFAVWWLFSIPTRIEGDLLLQRGRQLEREGKTDAAILNYEQALLKSPRDSATKLRLLSAYNSSLQVNKAKDLIQKLHGQTFHEGEIEEVQAIISQYRKIKLSKVRNRHRVMLID